MAHPAFPSLPPPGASSSSSSSGVPVIRSAKSVSDIITGCNTFDLIYHTLIPAFHDLAWGKGQPGPTPKEKADAGQDILALWDQDLYSLSQERILQMTAGLVFVVSARLSRPIKDGYNADLLRFATAVAMHGDRQQIRLTGPRVSSLAWGILRLAQHLKQPELALRPLEALTQVLDFDVFSGAYAAYLEACLITRRFDYALPATQPIFTDFIAGGPTYLDVITYYHHAGLVCAAVKDFARAKRFFSIAVAVPTSTGSAIQLTAAKRAILCGLLDNGELLSFPRYTSGTISRMIDRNAKEYTKLGKAFESHDWKIVREAAASKEFAEDCNYGLLEQVMNSISRRRILRIQTMYSRMTVRDLAAKVGLLGPEGVQQVGMVLQDMVATKSISASVSGDGEAVVTFHDDATDYNSQQTLLEVADVKAMATWLEKELARGSDKLGISRSYLKKQVGLLEGNGGPNGGKKTRGDTTDQVFGGAASRGGLKGVGADWGDMGF
ncbi:hypothetical protein JCM24511_00537 [Saitozyma sp. JCM 24511]|nr:hypothetical protein JCM24511_00537 [Saitozyma sp. JCM 24511]